MKTSTFNAEDYAAVLFDMDGVLTKTAKVHATCWKKMFDEYLRRYSDQNNIPFEPFSIEKDYKQFVDGKPRYVGVRSFLESRSIVLPEKSDDNKDSIQSLGDRKNQLIHDVLTTDGVEVYQDTLKFIRHIKQKGLSMALVTSSRNCDAIINAAGLGDLFEIRVDGNVALDLGLTGKPAPDIFIEAAKRVGVAPDKAVVVEDAISGVQAGVQGGFGLVIGLDRVNDSESLVKAGAHLVVSDLTTIIP